MNINIFEPRTLGAITEVLPETGGFFTNTFFKNAKPIEGTKADLEFRKGKRKILPFVSETAKAGIINKRGYESNTVETPLIKQSTITNVKDIKKKSFGEELYSNKTAEERAIEQLTEEANDLNNYLNRTIEWMAAQAFLTGKIPVKGEGIDYTIDFGFTNRVALAADKKWNATNANPLTDIDTFISRVKLTGGRTPNIAIMSKDVYEVFISNKKVQEMLDIKNMELALIKPIQLNENVTYGGTIARYNLSIYIYEEYYEDANGEEQPLVPAGTLLLASTRAKTTLFYGEIVIADKEINDFKSYITDRLLRSYIETNPDVRFLELQSRPLPTPNEVDSWLVATVL